MFGPAFGFIGPAQILDACVGGDILGQILQAEELCRNRRLKNESGYDEGERTMISKENASISVFLACLALLAVVSGLWMTRPVAMDPWGSLSAVVVIYIIVAGGPQILIFAAAVSSARQGRVLAAGWWTVANLVFVLQVGAGATFLAGAIVREERLLAAAAAVLVVAALVAVASTIAVSRVGWKKSGAARGS